MKIAIVGSYGVGMTMRLPRIPGPGETMLGGTFSSGPGGKGSNQAIAARRLGADVSLLTAVGNDRMGVEARDLWVREGVDASAVVTVDAATMVGLIMVEPDGENRISIASGALDLLTADHVESFRPQLAEADIVMVSLEIPVETALAALRIAKEEGTTTLLNPAPSRNLPRETWAYVDFVTPNRTAAAMLLGTTGGENLQESEAVRLHQLTGANVVLTLGGDGAVICSGQSTVAIDPVRPRTVMDTTGAGDAFTAAIAVELAAGASLEDAVKFAARVGAWVVGIPEVIPALPTRKDLI